MIVVAIIGLLAAIAIPNFVKARKTAQGNACINNLRQIDAAIQQYALENNLGEGASVAEDKIKLYMRGEVMPKCPTGDKAYVIAGSVNALTTVTCENANPKDPGHKLGVTEATP